MLRRLSQILLLTTLVAACSKNYAGYVPDDSLVFSAVASHSVKSIITTTNYPLDEPFAVDAVYYPDRQDGPGSCFMSGEAVEYYFEEATWKPRHEYFWPSRGTLVFYAGSPILPQVTFSTEHGIEADWEIPSDEYTQTDLCYAKVEADCSAHPASVPVVFNHALSQICFKARTQANYSYSRTEGNLIQANVITTVLDSVKIRGVISKGHFTQEPLGWKLDTFESAEYTVFRSEEGLPLHCDRYDTPTLYPLATMLLLPQVLYQDVVLEEWHHLVVRSSVTDTTTKQIVSDDTYTLPGYGSIHLADYCREWLMDFKYTFRLAVGQDVTEVSSAVTDWTETKELIIGDE